MRRTTSVCLLFAVCTSLLLTGGVQAAVVLTLEWDRSAMTWDVLAEIDTAVADGDEQSAGLASLIIDVFGTDGLQVESSQLELPYDLATGSGFAWFRNDGAQGIGIAASQPTIYSGDNNPAADSLVLQGVGLGDPVRIASGTYSGGDQGALHAEVGAGTFILLEGPVWQGPGNGFEAAEVLPASVPEPSTLVLLLVGLAAVAWYRCPCVLPRS